MTRFPSNCFNLPVRLFILFSCGFSAAVAFDGRVDLNVLVGADAVELPADNRQQAEPHIARNPVNPDQLLAVWQDGRLVDGGATAIGFAVSDNGGHSWSRGVIPGLTTLNGGPFPRATDPVAAIDRQNRFYLNALVSAEGVFATAAVVLLYSDDFGQTWSAPVEIFRGSSRSPDKNWMALNSYPGTPNTGRLAVTYTLFEDENTRYTLYLHTSDDRGLTWSSGRALTTHTPRVQGSQPMFFPSGALGVAYHVFTDTGTLGRLEFQFSPDGGETWDPPRLIQNYILYTDAVLRHGSFLPSATVDGIGTLHVAYGENVGGTGRIQYTRSTDRGISWSARQTISDNPGGRPAVSPSLAASADGQHVAVSYYEKSGTTGDSAYLAGVRAVQSFDGGLNWGTSLPLTESLSDARLAAPSRNNTRMLGDYFGLLPSGGVGSGIPAVALWIDTRPGNADPFTARLTAWPDSRHWTWTEQTSRGPNGSRSLEWFGSFWEVAFPWFFHQTHGWFYSTSTDDSGILIYEFALGYWWTNADLYPWLYDFAREGWFYYQPGSAQPRWFYNAATREWEQQ